MEKILIVSNLVQRAYNRWTFQQLLPSILLIAVLVIVSAVLVSTMLLIGAYMSYAALLNMGLTSQAATFIIMASMLLILLLLALSVILYLRYLRQLPRKMIQNAPIASSATALLNAFMNGLMAEQTPK
jgi:lysylphosphatidylglycerol synthetase-like protein (DUF2156 family)